MARTKSKVKEPESIKGNYQRGVTPLIVLSLLKTEDMYGYQLVQKTKEASGGAIDTQEGSLYPVLYRLERSGLISSKTVKSGERMRRIYYHIEPAGEESLKELAKAYKTVTDGVFRIIKAANVK